jgi:hypothetical protein
MALIKATEKYGVEFNDAYHKTETVYASKERGIVVDVGVYANAQAREAGALPLDRQSFVFPFSETLNGDNPVEQAYNLLKGLEEYADAADVL